MNNLLEKLAKSFEGFCSPLAVKLEWGKEYRHHLRVDGGKVDYFYFADVDGDFKMLKRDITLEEAQRLALKVFLDGETSASYHFWTRKGVD